MKLIICNSRVTGEDEYFIRQWMREGFKPDWMRREYSGCLDAPHWIPTGHCIEHPFENTVAVEHVKR